MSYLVLRLTLFSLLTRAYRASAVYAWAVYAKVMNSCSLCKSFIAHLVSNDKQRTDSLIRLYLYITYTARIW
jgi:hypothetical protein